MRIVRDFQLRTVDEQRWLSTNTWCETCGKADLGLENPIEYEEGGVVFVLGRCRKCGIVVTSNLSTNDNPEHSKLELYALVRIGNLVQSTDSYNAWKLNLCCPAVGDLGTVVEVLKVAGLPTKYVVESVDTAGTVLWCTDFYDEELELAIP